MWTLQSGAALLALALLALPLTQACDAPVSCKACDSPHSGANLVSSLPRRDFSFTSRSSNLGDGSYDIIQCGDADADTGCDVVDDIEIKDINDPKEDDSVLYYLQTIVMYLAVGLFFSMFSCCAGLIFALCRCCVCARCCRRSCCCGCGKMWPTRQTCLLGYTDRLGPKGKQQAYHYSIKQSLFARACYLVFAFLIIVFVGLGQFKGNQAFGPALETVADSPQGAADLVLNSRPSFNQLVIDGFSTVVEPTMRGIRDEFLQAIPLTEARGNLSCVQYNLLAAPSAAAITAASDDAIALVDSARDLVATADPDLNDLLNLFDVLSDSSTDALDIINGLDTTGTVVEDNAQVALDQLDDLAGVNTTLTAPSSGLYLPTLASDTEAATDAGNYPAAGDLTFAANGITDLLTGTFDGNTAAMSALGTSLETMEATMNAAPNVSEISSRLLQLRDVIATTSMNATIDALTAINNSVSSVPTADSVLAITGSMTNAFDELQVGPLYALVDDMETLVQTPVIRDLDSLLNDVANLADVLPCMTDLVSYVTRIHDTLLTIPSGVRDDVNKVLDDVNSTITDGLAEVADFRADLGNVQADLDNFTLAQFADIRTTLADVDNQTALARTTIADLNETVEEYGTSTSSLDLTSTLESLNNVESTLRSDGLEPPQDLLDALDALATANSGLSTNLGTASTNVLAYADATCTSTGCGGCVIGNPCPVAASACCAVALDDTTLEATRTQLQAYDAVRSTATGTDTSTLTTEMNSLHSTLGTIPSIDGSKTDISDVVSTFGSLPLSSAREDLTQVIDDLNSSGRTEVSNVLDSLADVDNALDDIPTTAEIRADVEELTDSLKTAVDDNKAHVEDALWYNDQAIDFVNNDLEDYLTRMQAPALNEALAAGGMDGLLRHLLTLGQDIIGRTNRAQNETDITTDLFSEASDGLRITEVLSTQAAISNGPVYFFFELMDEDSIHPPFDTGYIFEDINENEYPDDKVCVTSACITRTIKRSNSGTIDEATEGRVPLGVTRESLTLNLYLGVLLLVVVGLVGALGVCGTDSKWQYYPICISTTCLCLFLPLMFLVSGLLFVPVMLSSDYCVSYPNLAHQYVSGSLEYICQQLDGTPVGTAGECSFSIDLGLRDRELEFTANLPEVVSAVLGSCPEGDGPLASFFQSVRDNVNNYALEELTEELDKRDGKDWDPRPNIDTILTDGARAVDTTAVAFVDSVEALWGCAGVHAAVKAPLDALCCNLLDASYWMVASWYLIAWTILFAFPFMVMGCKRFPRGVWGWAVRQEDIAKAKVDQAQKHAAFQNPLHSPPGGPPSHHQNAGMFAVAPSAPAMELPVRRAVVTGEPVYSPQPVPEWGKQAGNGRQQFQPTPTR